MDQNIACYIKKLNPWVATHYSLSPWLAVSYADDTMPYTTTKIAEYLA